MAQWVDMAVGVIIATLSGMGIGSGGLLVLYLTFFRDIAQLRAQGMNLLFFLFSAASSMSVHLSRRHIRFGAVALMICAGLLGSVLGVRLAVALPEAWTRRLFGIFLILAGLPTLFSPAERKKKRAKQKI